MIEKLRPYQVFVFGSNLQGFHGAGAAGYASFNEHGNVWRKHKYDELPNGTKGKWNIKGVGWGFQIGTEGLSYAIPTVVSAGKKRSMPLDSIRKHIECFHAFATATLNYHYFVAWRGKLNGYSEKELTKIWFDDIIWPENVEML